MVMLRVEDIAYQSQKNVLPFCINRSHKVWEWDFPKQAHARKIPTYSHFTGLGTYD